MASRRRTATVYLCFVLLALWVLFPIYSAGLFSVMSRREARAVPVHWIPQAPTLAGFAGVLGLSPDGGGGAFAQSTIFRLGLFNGGVVAAATTLIAMLVSTLAAYSLARFDVPAKNGWLLLILVGQMVPAAALVIPYYVLFAAVNLLDTLQGMVLVYLAMTVPLATWILTGYFSSLPVDVERQARMDGVGRLGTLFRVVVPAAGSGLISVGIVVFFLCWGEFFFALILTDGSSAQLLAPSLLGLPAAATIVALLPVVALAAFFQRHITRLRLVDPGPITMGRRTGD